MKGIAVEGAGKMGNAARRTGVPQLVPAGHGAAEPIHEAASGDDIAGSIYHGLGAREVERDGLFDQEVDAGAGSLFDLALMGKGRQSDDQKVEPLVRKHGGKV